VAGGGLEFGILGPLEVRRGGELVALGAAKQRALLARLLLRPRESVPVDRLIEDLWGETAPRTASHTVQVYVSGLRKLLGAEAIKREGGGYAVDVVHGALDVDRFRSLVGRARAEAPKSAVATLSEALELWRGPALADFRYESFAQAPIAELDEERLAAVEERLAAVLACGGGTELVAELQTLVAEHPLRERLRGQLMLALYRSGRQAEALAAYQEARSALVEQLGIDPSTELQVLNRRILNQDKALTQAVLSADGHLSVELPVPASPLIGRQRELEEVRDLMHSSRLLTLTGAGGSGKTRLALAVAAHIATEFSDGVRFVSLAALSDPALIEGTIASTVGAKEDLAEFLMPKRLLLVLDNVEQLLPDAAPSVARLLAAPRVRVLATSRERLAISAEQEYPVPTLPHEDAVELFVQRARQLKPSFEPDEHVMEIARRLDGLPLALELAASRIKVLTPQQIFERLTTSLDLLVGGARDAPERQRTLRATIHWSYDLLAAGEQRLFLQLAVFRGSFDLDAAVAVAGADVETLSSLIDKSLIRQRSDGGRFFMLETIREFALETLNEPTRDDVTQRHADHYLLVAEEARQRGRDGNLSGALSILDAERENVRAALAQYESTRATQQLFRLIEALAYYWIVRGQLREGDRWIQRALADSEEAEPRLVAELLIWQSDFVRLLGDLDGALTSAREALARSREIDDARLIARSLHEVGESFVALGDTAAAKNVYEQALEAARAAGETAAGTVGNLGDLALAQGNFEEALVYLDEARNLFETQRDGTGRFAEFLIANYNYAVALLHLDRGDEACALLKDSLVGLHDLGYVEGTAWALMATAMSLASQNRGAVAARLLGAAEQMLEETGAHVGPTERRLHDIVGSVVDEQALAGERANGRSLTPAQAVELALRSLD
jgi:predicted ATPase/DNA-binding SARP family transcriptional activator